MTGEPLSERLAGCTNLSRAESAVALWMERNIDALPYGSAADIAAGARVSEMSVVRFVRRLRYNNLKALKASMRDAPPGHAGALDDRGHRFALPSEDSADLSQNECLEIQAIREVYALSRTPAWQDALDVIVDAAHVNVTGFQASKGLALDFATRLKYARPGVRFAEGTSGNWSELFAEGLGCSSVVLVDTAAYSPVSFRIADMCLREGVPMVMVTDRFSTWPRKYTPHVLAVRTMIGTYWDSTAGLSALLGLMVNAVTARIGPAAADRLREMSRLGRHFDAYANDPERAFRPIRPAEEPTEKEDR